LQFCLDCWRDEDPGRRSLHAADKLPVAYQPAVKPRDLSASPGIANVENRGIRERLARIWTITIDATRRTPRPEASSRAIGADRTGSEVKRDMGSILCKIERRATKMAAVGYSVPASRKSAGSHG
jgi:hypothetical protein